MLKPWPRAVRIDSAAMNSQWPTPSSTAPQVESGTRLARGPDRDGRERGPIAQALPALAGGVAIGNGLLMLIAPAQFRSPAYALISPFLWEYAAVLVAGGAGLLYCAVQPKAPRWFSLGVLALVPLWVSFFMAGLITGVITLGVQIVAGGLGGAGVSSLRLLTHPALATFGVIQLLQAAAMVLAPRQFASTVLYGNFGTQLAILAPSFALAGLGLLFAKRRWLVFASGLLGACNFGWLAAAFVGTRLWTGVLNYGLMLFLLGWAISSGPASFRATRLLWTGAALFPLADIGAWVGGWIGAPIPDPVVTSFQPGVALGLLTLAGSAAWIGEVLPSKRAVALGACAVSGIVVLVSAVDALAATGLQTAVLAQASELRPDFTTTFALALVTVAYGLRALPLSATSRAVAGAAAAIVCTVSAANVLAYVINQPALFAGFGIGTMGLHSGMAFLLAAAAILVVVVPEAASRSLTGRLSAGFTAVLLLVALEAFIAVSMASGTLGALLRDPATAARDAEAATGALVGLVAIILAVVVTISFALTTSITGPFRELTVTMRAFGRGDRTARAALRSRDEIGQAAVTFNSMARDLQTAQEQLEQLALHDPLTGLPNRRLFADRTHQAILDAKRSEGNCAVLELDLDGFKAVNDTFGHAAGDELLIEVAARVRQLLRPADTLARLGGDEFAVVLPTASRTAGEDIAERLRTEISRPFALGSAVAQVSTSIGLACYPEDGGTPETLLAIADMQMYAAKRATVGRP